MIRNRTSPIATLAVAITMVLAACGSSGQTTNEGGSRTAETGSQTETSSGWQEIAITDTTGETYTIADLAGTPVFVENFATWCGNCRKQLDDTQKAAESAGDTAIFLALSIETDLDTDAVASYAADNGFDDVRFAVMSPEMLAAMNDAYGKTALNAPSTPKILVAADGTAGKMVTGFESPAEIADALSGAT